MSPRTTSRGLERGHFDRATTRQGGAAAVAAAQEPADRPRVVLDRVIAGLFAAAVHTRRDAHDIANGLHLDGDRSRSTTRRSQQRDDHGVHDRRGLRARGHDVTGEDRRDRAAAQVGMLVEQTTRNLERVAQQHRFEPGVDTTGELTHERQQTLESVSIAAQPVEKSRVGCFVHIEHTRRGADRRQAVADSMREAAQQIVMNSEPALRLVRRNGLGTH